MPNLPAGHKTLAALDTATGRFRASLVSGTEAEQQRHSYDLEEARRMCLDAVAVRIPPAVTLPLFEETEEAEAQPALDRTAETIRK